MVDEGVRSLAHGANFAVLTTLLPGGNPQTHLMWVDCDDDFLLLNTEVGRRKYENVKQDPRVAVAVWDGSNPYRYAEVRGEVADMVTGPEAREHIDRLSLKYTGKPYPDAAIKTERVILKIRPARQIVRG